MSDRELLELAAKAAGIEIPDDCVFIAPDYWKHDATNTHIIWNPLGDDGDALRLAVKLRLVISPNDVTVMVYEPSTMRRGEVYELVGADPLAATRRAITRAAAEIGRTMP